MYRKLQKIKRVYELRQFSSYVGSGPLLVTSDKHTSCTLCGRLDGSKPRQNLRYLSAEIN